MRPEALAAIEAYRLHTRELAPDTRKHYLSSIRRFFRQFAVPPEGVSPEHIERYILNSGLSLTAATKELTRLGTFFGFLVHQGQLAANPCAQANLRPLRWALAERRIARRGIVREHVHVRERPEEPLILRPAKTTDPRDEAVVAFAQRMRRKHYSRQYIKDCVSTLRRFLAFFPDLALEAVTAAHVERFLDAQVLSPRSYATNVERIRVFYRYLIRHQGLTIRNPTEDVETPRRPVRFRPAPTREEFARLVAATRTPEERLLVEFIYYTGARLSELRGIRLRDVDLERRRVRIIGKGDKERIVVFPPHVGELIVNWTGGLPPEAFLLESPQHFAYPRSPLWIGQTLRAIGRRAGLPYTLTAHILRHGFARLCKTRGMPLEVTARLMGHEHVSTTAALYGRLDADDLQQVYDRVIGEEGTP